MAKGWERKGNIVIIIKSTIIKGYCIKMTEDSLGKHKLWVLKSWVHHSSDACRLPSLMVYKTNVL